MEKQKLLSVEDLTVGYRAQNGFVCAVNKASFSLSTGEILGLVGESGSGKSTCAYAVMQLLASNGEVLSGKIIYEGRNLLDLSSKELRKVLGNEIGMIFQDPIQSLDPSYTVGAQLIETVRTHKRIGKTAAYEKAVDVLRKVRFSEPKKIMNQYGFELSGGMCQRVMIAMALILEPKILITDEATSALDATVQDQVLSLISDYVKKTAMSVLCITHNFGVVASICDSACVMYRGNVVETGTVNEVFHDYRHPYTEELMRAIPKLEVGNKKPMASINNNNMSEKTDIGCVFRPRCAYRSVACNEQPKEIRISDTHTVSCAHYASEGTER